VELLVVVVIIIVAGHRHLHGCGSARRSAIKVADLNNLRSLATAAMAAGSDNAGRFPYIHATSNSAPYYLRDRDTLESLGIFKESCYIKDTKAQGGAPNYAWWFMFANQTPTHYCYFAKDAPSGISWFQRGSVTPPNKDEYRGSIPYDDIIMDPTKAFARNFTDEAWYPILWAGICRDYPGSNQLAAVMKGGVALGVNVIHIDGSAKWVDKKT
jgi:hypothetical protein